VGGFVGSRFVFLTPGVGDIYKSCSGKVPREKFGHRVVSKGL